MERIWKHFQILFSQLRFLEYSPTSRFAYKSVGIFKVNLVVFAIDPPASRYNFLPELVKNFSSMFCWLNWLKIRIYFNRRCFYLIFWLTIKSILMLFFISLAFQWTTPCVSVNYSDAISISNLITIFSTHHMPLIRFIHLVSTLTHLEKYLFSYIHVASISWT
jgi:hypothetical protein